MRHILFNQCRDVLRSGNVWNCLYNQQQVQSVEMFEHFTVEAIGCDQPYCGKPGDHIIVHSSGELYISQKDFFNKNYKVTNGWDMRQYATNAEDAHFGIGYWSNSPFNDETLRLLSARKNNERVYLPKIT